MAISCQASTAAPEKPYVHVVNLDASLMRGISKSRKKGYSHKLLITAHEQPSSLLKGGWLCLFRMTSSVVLYFLTGLFHRVASLFCTALGFVGNIFCPLLGFIDAL